MQTTKTNSLQFKLSFDEGLKKTWEYLSQEYEALDKASIVRLALNNLAKTTKKQETLSQIDVLDILENLKSTEKGINEDEFYKWWNENKSSL